LYPLLHVKPYSVGPNPYSYSLSPDFFVRVLSLNILWCATEFADPLCGQLEFVAANPEVPGSIPDSARFSAQQWVWNGVHSDLVRVNEELLERKIAAPV
jgi:hypothetical protein